MSKLEKLKTIHVILIILVGILYLAFVMFKPDLEKEVEVPIDFIPYDNSVEMSAGTHCEIEIVGAMEAAVLSNYVEFSNNFTNVDMRYYYLAFDKDYKPALVIIPSTYKSEFEGNFDGINPVRFVGKIVEPPEDSVYIPDLVWNELDDTSEYWQQKEEDEQTLKELLNKYPILEIDTENKSTKTVYDGLGVGMYMLFAGGGLVIAVIIVSALIKKEKEEA